jgi:hypothetical protein
MRRDTVELIIALAFVCAPMRRGHRASTAASPASRATRRAGPRRDRGSREPGID